VYAAVNNINPMGSLGLDAHPIYAARWDGKIKIKAGAVRPPTRISAA